MRETGSGNAAKTLREIERVARDKDNVAYAVVRAAAIAMLAWAYAGHPIGYYTSLRFAVCATCAYGAYRALKSGSPGWVWAMTATAVLFNPIVPVHLTREHWAVIDAIAAMLLLLSIPLLRPVKDGKVTSTDGGKG